MNRNLASVLLASVLATFNRSLLAAVTVMLLLPHPKRLMAGDLLGTYTTSIILGLVIAFSLDGSSAFRTSKHTVSPGVEVLAGVLALGIAFVLATRRDAPLARTAQTGEANRRGLSWPR